jgi:hypothetical protein
MSQRTIKVRHTRRRRSTASKKSAVVEQLLRSPAVADSPPHVRAWLTQLLRRGERAAGTAAGRQEGGGHAQGS